MRQALGKGLDALIPGSSKLAEGSNNSTPSPLTIPIAKVRPNRLQPRQTFQDESLSDLAQSIRRHGIAQPILVTKGVDGEFELIAGERRLRAAKLAGLTEIPAVVREKVADQERLTLALIENIQREDLNAIEAAQAYRKLMAEHNLSQTDLAEAIGKSRSAVANTMRLLELPESIQTKIVAGELTEGHGRALLMVEDAALRQTLCERALAQKMSVRELEDAARFHQTARATAPRERYHPVELKNLETDLQHALGTKVRVNCSKKGVGSLVIEFYSLEDLERLTRVLNK